MHQSIRFLIALVTTAAIVVTVCPAQDAPNAARQLPIVKQLLPLIVTENELIEQDPSLSPATIANVQRFANANVHDAIDAPSFAEIEQVYRAAVVAVESKGERRFAEAIAVTEKTRAAATAKLASPGGLFNETAILDALGTYLARRLRDELVSGFMETFRSHLSTDRIMLLRHLFPATLEFLDVRDGSGLPTFGRDWRAAFEKDLRAILPHAWAYISKNVAFKVFQEKMPQLDALLRFFVVAGGRLSEGRSIADALDFARDSIDVTKPDGKVLMLMVTLMSKLRNVDGTFMTLAEFRASDKPEWRENLVKQVISDLKAVGNGVFDDWKAKVGAPMSTNEKMIGYIFDGMRKILLAFGEADRLVQEMHGEGATMVKIADVAGRVSRLIDVVVASYNLYQPAPPPAVASAVTKATTIARSVAELFGGIARREYGTVFAHGLLIVKTVLDSNRTDGDTKQDSTLMLLERYGSMLVDIVSADSPDDVEAALERAALPVGSYRIMRTYSRSLSLCAYAGFSGGWEWLRSGAGFEPPAASLGFTAPIGLNLAFGGSCGSFSVFLSLIDIGAIASYRLSDTATGPMPNIGFAQVLSPGLGVRWGFKDVPLSIGGLISLTPKLREVSSAGTTVDRDALRAALSLAVDLPLFLLYKSSE